MAKQCVKYPTARMDKRVLLQGPSYSSDGQGGSQETWNDISQVWAQIQPLNGYEKMQAMMIQSPITHKVMMRYRSDVTTALRLLYQDRVFDIKEVINVDEAKAFLQLRCVESGVYHPEIGLAIFEDGAFILFQDGSYLLLPDNLPGDTQDLLNQDGSTLVLMDGSVFAYENGNPLAL
jgi:SPP1 family predicted phage head-tail adaptor